MTLEEQLQKALKNREQTRKNITKATTLFFSQAEEHVAPCKDILSEAEATDERWSPEARKVFSYVIERSDLSDSKESYKTLYHLVEKIEDTDEMVAVSEHILWMTSFSLLADTEEQVDFLLSEADKCEECRESMILWTMQYLVMDCPMSPKAVYSLVHAGCADEFRGLIWCDLEGLADGMYWVEEPQDSPWKQLCKETNSENVAGMLEYVKSLKTTA